jgi:hypothetical protein
MKALFSVPRHVCPPKCCNLYRCCPYKHANSHAFPTKNQSRYTMSLTLYMAFYPTGLMPSLCQIHADFHLVAGVLRRGRDSTQHFLHVESQCEQLQEVINSAVYTGMQTTLWNMELFRSQEACGMHFERRTYFFAVDGVAANLGRRYTAVSAWTNLELKPFSFSQFGHCACSAANTRVC